MAEQSGGGIAMMGKKWQVMVTAGGSYLLPDLGDLSVVRRMREKTVRGTAYW